MAHDPQSHVMDDTKIVFFESLFDGEVAIHLPNIFGFQITKFMVLEIIAAHHLGVRCLCISMVSNPAAGLSETPVTHEEVLAAGQAAAGNLRKLLGAVLGQPGLV